MIFCNVVGVTGELKRGSSAEDGRVYPIVINETEPKEGAFVAENGKIVYKGIEEGTQEIADGGIFGAGLRGEGTYRMYKSKKGRVNTVITYEDIADTAENPILVVYCKEIALFKGIEADLKVLYMGSDGILAALIYGACEFDGVALQRCYTGDLSEKEISRKIGGVELKNFLMCSHADKTGGYNYYNDAVLQVRLIDRVDASGSYGLRCSMVNSGEYIFDKRGIESAEKAYTEKLKREEETKKAVAEKRRVEMEDLARKRAERAAQEEAEAEAAKAQKGSGRSLKSEKAIVESVGASAFLAAVSSMRGN